MDYYSRMRCHRDYDAGASFPGQGKSVWMWVRRIIVENGRFLQTVGGCLHRMRYRSPLPQSGQEINPIKRSELSSLLFLFLLSFIYSSSEEELSRLLAV